MVVLLNRLSAMLSLQSVVLGRSISTMASPLLFRLSPFLSAEPLKKKKKIDPAVIRMREERKKRKLEKEIRKLEKVARKWKPIDELEVPPKLLEEKKMRLRKLTPLSEEEKDCRCYLLKEWNRYKNQQFNFEMKSMERMVAAQEKALNQLRLVSEDLYQAALEPDLTLLPFCAKGPVHTPPIIDYPSVDGDYKDVTRKWE